MNQPQQSQRAPRFTVPIAILYRTPGNPVWLEGRTENISQSGVLFCTDHAIELDTPVELLLEIPTWVATPIAGPAICRGRIVRSVPPSLIEHRPAFAASILEYSLARPFDPRRI